MEYNFEQGTVSTSSGIRYNIEWCKRGMLKFNEKSPEYAFFMKMFVFMARKLSNANYEGDIIKV